MRCNVESIKVSVLYEHLGIKLHITPISIIKRLEQEFQVTSQVVNRHEVLPDVRIINTSVRVFIPSETSQLIEAAILATVSQYNKIEEDEPKPGNLGMSQYEIEVD